MSNAPEDRVIANKKLEVAGGELKLAAKKVKGEKQPKRQAKTGKGRSEEVEVAEPVETTVERLTTEVEQL